METNELLTVCVGLIVLGMLGLLMWHSTKLRKQHYIYVKPLAVDSMEIYLHTPNGDTKLQEATDPQTAIRTAQIMADYYGVAYPHEVQDIELFGR